MANIYKMDLISTTNGGQENYLYVGTAAQSDNCDAIIKYDSRRLLSYGVIPAGTEKVIIYAPSGGGYDHYTSAFYGDNYTQGTKLYNISNIASYMVAASNPNRCVIAFDAPLQSQIYIFLYRGMASPPADAYGTFVIGSVASYKWQLADINQFLGAGSTYETG